MTSVTTKPDSLQPQTETAVHLFDNWIDPIETEIRGRIRGFIEEVIRSVAADHLFDEPTDAPADLGLNRINPVVEKMDCSLSLRLQGIRLRGNACHGVVSSQ